MYDNTVCVMLLTNNSLDHMFLALNKLLGVGNGFKAGILTLSKKITIWKEIFTANESNLRNNIGWYFP